MRRSVLLLATLFVLATALFAQAPKATTPARIRIGDELTVYVFGEKDLSGPFTVQSDGAIYVPRAGRILVAGLTAQDAQSRFLNRLRTIFVNPTATVSIDKQRESSVFVVGGTQGVVPFGSETDLRQVYAAAKVNSDPDLINVGVFRNGRRIASMSGTDLTSGRPGVFNGPLQPNDLVVFEPKPFLRVWVVGTVQNPGRKRLNIGDDVYRAIAEAGDLAPEPATGPTRLRSDYVVTIQRGPETIPVPLVVDPTKPRIVLEENDTVSVQPPSQIRVTFTGAARNPGERFYKAGTPLATAVGDEGGAAVPTTTPIVGSASEPEGSLKGVILFHNGIASFHDLSPTPEGPVTTQTPVLGDGDVVYIPRNERTFFVFGLVNRVGRVTMQDNRPYRLSDAVAEAGGIVTTGTTTGTLTRVSVGRAGPDGKLVVKSYRLDKFIKGGDEKENPILQPNDVVYVDSSRGITFQSAVSAISAALLLNTLFKQ